MANTQENSSSRRKLALIIGNDNYSALHNKLNHSINNAQDLSDVLKKIDFNVTTACNLTKQEIITNIIDFSGTISNGDIVLFYFSGHGYEVKKKNYMIPVDDAVIETERDIQDFSVNIERTLSRLVTRNSSYVTILILDCCQPYWLQPPTTSRSTARGKSLDEIQPLPGSFIQFACVANQTVDDSGERDRNCLFTKHLLDNIGRKNVDVADIFLDISKNVYHESNRSQKPLSMNGLDRYGRVFLNEVIEPDIKDFLSKQLLPHDEKVYYDRCKEYCQLTKQPLISVGDEIFDDTTEVTSLLLVLGIEEDPNLFDLKDFLAQFCRKINIPVVDLQVQQIQIGSCIVITEIWNKFKSSDKKVRVKMICKSLTQKLLQKLGLMKIFFIFMGTIESLKRQFSRTEIRLNPEYDRIYAPGHTFWEGANNDRKDRGNQPYYCPVGWKRFSLYVTDNFYGKFKGWCICYHGTKFAYGLSILLSGLKPATRIAHGAGVYATPSVKYACHPRYAEVRLIEEQHRSKIFKSGSYMQYVLECRVHPDNIEKIGKETLNARSTAIDPNISNESIEWVINHQNKNIVDFNDPKSSIVCTGILMRVTDNHPGLLFESQWWFPSHLCEKQECCALGIDLSKLKRQRNDGNTCNIILE
ncbi:unnamed protein product [Rotaria socialis]|uniref:Caspase family p20 domain-containing protein n=2 Tax=Rotaria socialis TaxID=392032 RepID=A0A819ALP7_9BILA|nr:unnamed protein product [Rotaria socialis]CAF3779488.1 unnamed protein product [Rotaria socialis]CAF4436262.1 unnamed protein product [Rotaria socialis]CAF4667132.1 unnamed protein product [Rotaria socialis]